MPATVRVYLLSGAPKPLAGQRVRLHTYLPTGKLQGRAVVYDGRGRASYGAWTLLPIRAWSELSVPVPGSAVGGAGRIDLVLGGPSGTFSGDLYLDTVQW
jgi:hypothetical protein